MIKKLLVSTVAMATLYTSASADLFGIDAGVGVSVTGSQSVIRTPIKLNDTMRVEPYIAFVSSDLVADNITLGAAFHMLEPVNNNLNLYYGAYAGLSDNTAWTDVYLGPVAGVEYSFDKQFSLGAEVSLDLGFGDATDVRTSSEVTLRYYF